MVRHHTLERQCIRQFMSLCRVIGNNRTKNQLVGQLGIVKTATGLGGWHRVVKMLLVVPAFQLHATLDLGHASLSQCMFVISEIFNALVQVLDIGGEEVRLQRNALMVVSRPKGDETVRYAGHLHVSCSL